MHPGKYTPSYLVLLWPTRILQMCVCRVCETDYNLLIHLLLSLAMKGVRQSEGQMHSIRKMATEREQEKKKKQLEIYLLQCKVSSSQFCTIY